MFVYKTRIYVCDQSGIDKNVASWSCLNPQAHILQSPKCEECAIW